MESKMRTAPPHEPTPALQEWLADVKRQVDARLERFFAAKLARAAELSAANVEITETLRDFTLRGGKRTRPAVLVGGYLAISALPDYAALLDACAGLELLQSYLLVHDDWMDQDAERRGGPAVHTVFEERLGDAHQAACMAVLAGDLANAFALELVAGGPTPVELAPALLEVFWEMQQDVVWGQQLDLLAHEDVSLIHRLKTGSYSVRGPLLLGAVLAGASPGQRAALEAYADPVGLAFQGRDDLLGVFGDPARTGKPAGNDLRAGKRTVLIEEVERRLPPAERGPIDRVFGDPSASHADVAAAMALLQRSGARAAVEARVRGLRDGAAQALEGADLRGEGVRRLLELADKFVQRDH